MPGAHPLCCEACLHLFLLTRLALYVTGLVCLFSSLGLPSVLHGLCALQGFMSASLLAPQACSLHCEVHVGCRVCTLGLSWHPRPTLYAMGFLWASFSSLTMKKEKCTFLGPKLEMIFMIKTSIDFSFYFSIYRNKHE